MKYRQNLYIDREIADALDALSARPGGNKSRIVNDALADWLARRGSAQVEERLEVRLDRMTRDIARLGRDVDILLESLALFVRYQLTVSAPLPDDAAVLAVGRERFEKFVGQVGRQRSAGKRSLGGEE